MSRFRDEKECIDVAEKDTRQKYITQLTTLKKVFFTLFVQINRFYSGRGGGAKVWWVNFFFGKSRLNSWKVIYTMGVSLCLRRTSIVPRVRRIPIDDKHRGTIANIDTQDICSTWTINQSISE